MSDRSTVFTGLKVVELATVLAGPSVGTFLAELGASVIKIENPLTSGDPTRQWKTAKENPSSNISAYYSSANWGKEIVYLNLKDTADYQKIKSLINEADILLINFRAGDEKRYNLEFESLKKVNPRLIVGHIQGFPNDDRPAFDIVLQAETGLMSLNGDEGMKGLKWPLPVVDILAAHQLKEGLLVALYQRSMTGKGSLVEVSLFDAAVASLFNVGTNVLMGGADPGALGPFHPNIAPYGEILQSSDKQTLVLAVGTDKQFASLCAILKAQPSFLADFSTNRSRVINRKQLGNELNKLASTMTFDELYRGLTSNKIPFGRIKSVKSVLDELPEDYFLRSKIDGIETVRLRSAIFSIRS